MASEKITAIIEELKGLTVLELSELVHAVEDEFGVSAAAAVAVAGPAADGGAAAAPHLHARSRRRADHLRGHLLRGHVRRLDDEHPPEHAGGVGLDSHGDRGQQDGQDGARCRCARHRGHRVLHRRHPGDVGADAAGSAARAVRGEPGTGGLRRPHRDRVHHGRRADRQLDLARDALARRRVVPRSRRHRLALRTAALHAGASRVVRRRRHRPGSCRAVRGRGDVLHRRPVAARRRRRDPRDTRVALLDDQGRVAEVMEALAARQRHRFPDRRAASRRHGNPDLPLLRAGAPPDQAPRGVRAGRDRGRRRARGGQ